MSNSEFLHIEGLLAGRCERSVVSSRGLQGRTGCLARRVVECGNPCARLRGPAVRCAPGVFVGFPSCSSPLLMALSGPPAPAALLRVGWWRWARPGQLGYPEGGRLWRPTRVLPPTGWEWCSL